MDKQESPAAKMLREKLTQKKQGSPATRVEKSGFPISGQNQFHDTAVRNTSRKTRKGSRKG